MTATEPLLREREEVQVENFPTRAIPGSQEKKDILCQRYDAGFPLFHPDDFTWAKNVKGLYDISR